MLAYWISLLGGTADRCNIRWNLQHELPDLLTCASTGTNVLPVRRCALTYKSTGHRNYRTSTLDFQVWRNIRDLVYKRKFDRCEDIIHGTVNAAPCINDRDSSFALHVLLWNRQDIHRSWSGHFNIWYIREGPGHIKLCTTIISFVITRSLFALIKLSLNFLHL